jgi:hypothetical protein
MGVYRMTMPQIHGKRTTFNETLMLESVGNAIGSIKSRDALTWDDVGVAFGKSRDIAAHYRAGSTEMGLAAFIRCIPALGDEVANAALAFVGKQIADLNAPRPTTTDSKIAKLATTIATLSQLSAGGLTEQQRRALGNHIDDLRLIADELAAGVVA